jgi:hypothetical protein
MRCIRITLFASAQEGQVKAWATGKFIHKPELADLASSLNERE